MGTWGTGIFADDNAADLREDFRDMIARGISGPEATDRLIEQWHPLSAEPEFAAMFWLGLAVTQWKCGRLEDRVKTNALKAITDGSALSAWRGSRFEANRRSVLEAARRQLESPQPRARSIAKRILATCEWEPTELIAYRLLSGDFIILRVVKLSSDKGGTYPDCEPLDYQGGAIPSAQELRSLPIRPRVPGALGAKVFRIVSAGKRKPDDRIVRLNVTRSAATLPPPKNVSFPTTIVTWKSLDLTLERDFGFH